MRLCLPRCRRALLPMILLVAAALLAPACRPRTEEPAPSPAPSSAALPPECNNHSTCPGSTCLTSVTAETASAVPPIACPSEEGGQSSVDIFGWNQFIALNWPANVATCGPDTSKSIGDPGPRVWETYALDTDIFRPSGPGTWCPQDLAARLAGPRPFSSVSKVSLAVQQAFPAFKEAFAGPLTDQNGRWVRYEIRVNQDELNYIQTNNLWNAAGQAGKTISFPGGPDDLVCNGQSCGPTGAIELKAAWKVLSDTEKASGRFYMTQATVYNDAQGDPSPGGSPVTLGLVGFHIVHKTTDQSGTRFWSTFEQVDNTTSSFFDPSCAACPDNGPQATEPYVELNPDGTPINTPVQVVRTNSLESTDSNAVALNAYYRGLLKGTVWENYQLISTQWPTGINPGGTPAVLANTVLETFVQADSSCIGCHNIATTKTTPPVPADQSFLLGEAQ